MKRFSLITIVFSLIATGVISLTPVSQALIHDAQSYYSMAVAMASNHNILGGFIFPATSFIDRGYPAIMATMINIFGEYNILSLQIANYIYWLLTAYIIYKALDLLNAKKNLAILMLFSPLYLTFSSKLYSESYASLGTSLILYAVIAILLGRGRFKYISLLIGAVILFSTKSVFLLFYIPLFLIFFTQQKTKAALILFVSLAVLLPGIVSSSRGGRSIYNLAIQSSKLEQGYDEILACVPYYLSYPIGQKLLPTYEGACHQNDPNMNQPHADLNPYHLASLKRESGYALSDWIIVIAQHPFKYLIVMMVSMANILWFEGVYPSILLQLPSQFIFFFYLFAKIVLSLSLWYYGARYIIKTNRSNRSAALALLVPLLYFFFVVGNFPVEQRYFYPLVPYVYFLAIMGITSVDKSRSHQ